MKNYSLKMYIVLLVFCSLVMTACISDRLPKAGVQPPVKPSGGEVIQQDSERAIPGAPAWVNKGSRLLLSQNGRHFHGVASAAPMGDMALQKAVADDRARDEIERLLSSYLDRLAADYLASLRVYQASKRNAALSNPVSEEALVSQTRSSIKQVTLGTRIIGSWRDSKTIDMWSIAELDLLQVKNIFAAKEGIDADLKRYIEAEAGNIFDRISEEHSRAVSAADR